MTFWQSIDYISQKIDYRLIVDIIDTPGHPANVYPQPLALIYTDQATLFGQYRRIMEEDGEAKEDEKDEV